MVPVQRTANPVEGVPGSGLTPSQLKFICGSMTVRTGAPEKDGETLLAAVRSLLDAGRDLWLLHRSGGYRAFLHDAQRFQLLVDGEGLVARPEVGHPTLADAPDHAAAEPLPSRPAMERMEDGKPDTSIEINRPWIR